MSGFRRVVNQVQSANARRRLLRFEALDERRPSPVCNIEQFRGRRIGTVGNLLLSRRHIAPIRVPDLPVAEGGLAPEQ
jgi:hypothetical protein